MNAVKCDNITLGYEGKNIITDLSFSVSRGSYLCIVGENGSGKSTLMKGLLGLIKPYSGTIEISDAKIGYLPQQTLVQRDFPASVFEIILSGRINSHPLFPLYTNRDKKAAVNAAKRMKISDILKSPYCTLSGGQKQRVLLARALCAAGNLLILDEPVAGLDPLITGEMYSLISELNRKDKMTIIMVSHDIDAALNYATHILHIGTDSYFFGTAEQYRKTDSAKNFLGGDIHE